MPEKVDLSSYSLEDLDALSNAIGSRRRELVPAPPRGRRLEGGVWVNDVLEYSLMGLKISADGMSFHRLDPEGRINECGPHFDLGALDIGFFFRLYMHSVLDAVSCSFSGLGLGRISHVAGREAADVGSHERDILELSFVSRIEAGVFHVGISGYAGALLEWSVKDLEANMPAALVFRIDCAIPFEDIPAVFSAWGLPPRYMPRDVLLAYFASEQAKKLGAGPKRSGKR